MEIFYGKQVFLLQWKRINSFQFISNTLSILITRNVLNEFDYENKIPDNSDYSHSIVQFFPHSFTSYEDTQISIHSYQRNRFKPRTNYLGISFYSFMLFFRKSFTIFLTFTICFSIKTEYSSSSSINSKYDWIINQWRL